MKPFHYTEVRSKYPTHTEVFGDIRVTITYDELAEAPYESYDMAARHFFWSDSRNSQWVRGHVEEGDKFSYDDKIESLAAKYVPQKKILSWFKGKGYDGHRLVYDRHEHRWKMEYYSEYYQEWRFDFNIDNLYDNDTTWLLEYVDSDTLVDALGQVKDLVIVADRLIGYCQGDVTHIISTMTLDEYKERVEGTPRKDWQSHAKELIAQEQEEIRCWVYGQVWKGAIEKRVPNDPDDPDDDHSDDDNDDNWQLVDDDDICHGPYYSEDEDQVCRWVAEDAGYDISNK